MNATPAPAQYAINAGLYGEFYIVRTNEDGSYTISPSYPTFLAASEAL